MRAGVAWDETLGRILTQFGADSGTIHLLGDDGVLHLKAASAGIPQVVLDTIKDVPVGKGMAGLAVERRQPVNACNIQTDTSGDVRPGARVTGLQGSVVVPMLRGDACDWGAGRGESPRADVHGRGGAVARRDRESDRGRASLTVLIAAAEHGYTGRGSRGSSIVTGRGSRGSLSQRDADPRGLR